MPKYTDPYQGKSYIEHAFYIWRTVSQIRQVYDAIRLSREQSMQGERFNVTGYVTNRTGLEQTRHDPSESVTNEQDQS